MTATRHEDATRNMMCGDCQFWYAQEGFKDFGVCLDPFSDHYQHLIRGRHVACKFFKFAELENEGG